MISLTSAFSRVLPPRQISLIIVPPVAVGFTQRTRLGATEGFVQLTIVEIKCTQNTQLGATESGEIRRSLELHFIQQSIKVLETIKTFTLLYI